MVVYSLVASGPADQARHCGRERDQEEDHGQLRLRGHRARSQVSQTSAGQQERGEL